MLRKSFYVIALQFIGILLSAFSLYVIAGNMTPETYSLVGVYNIVTNFCVTFSQFGLETVMMRNALYWREHNQENKIKEFFTQAIFIRCITMALFSPFIYLYLTHLNETRYENQYKTLFLLFCFSGFAKAMIDTLKSIIKSLGGYVYSQFIDVVNNTVLKIIAMYSYIKYGAVVYLVTLCLMPIIMMIIIMFHQKDNFQLKLCSLKSTFNKIREVKYLWLRSYLDYIRNYADSFLVSVFFSSSILGSYSIFKTLEQMARNVIEGFFDVLTQNMVRYKNMYSQLVSYEKKIRLVKNYALLFVCIMTVIYWLLRDSIIQLMNLQKYAYIEYLILCVAFISVLYLVGKIQINIISLFDTMKVNCIVGIIVLVITVASYLILIISDSIAVLLLQRCIIYFAFSITAIVFMKKRRKKIYGKNFDCSL